MIIKNGNVFLNNVGFVNADLTISDGVITGINKDNLPCDNDYPAIDNHSDNTIIDATNCYVIPGLVDIHLHGCMGHDFCEGTSEAFDCLCQYELSQGVTSICPATMTISKDELRHVFTSIGNYSNLSSVIKGITMEGPFLSASKKGAQNSSFLCKPDIDFFIEMQNLCHGMIVQVSIAPEEDANYSFIREATGTYHVVCSLAHSAADYDTASKAIQSGANHVTHLYNGMNNMTHRSPGIPGAAYDNKNVYVELITDGIHVSPTAVRMAFDLYGSNRICMISDSMEATGLSDGSYSLGGQPVQVTGKLATLNDGTIAGSASSLMSCLRTAVSEMGISLEDAVRSCTHTPAVSLGLDHLCGSISLGMPADLVILDKELNIIRVITHKE